MTLGLLAGAGAPLILGLVLEELVTLTGRGEVLQGVLTMAAMTRDLALHAVAVAGLLPADRMLLHFLEGLAESILVSKSGYLHLSAVCLL